ncbi:unnamed protein product [Pieris brassicae]|uniref:Uncharacterized protein n=1 Tax=Pieris brassicae TaxID=7116 RepID=A0A9P0XE10_PIEBR|nr:unnamed protein product [Pieris brassicae]
MASPYGTVYQNLEECHENGVKIEPLWGKGARFPPGERGGGPPLRGGGGKATHTTSLPATTEKNQDVNILYPTIKKEILKTVEYCHPIESQLKRWLGLIISKLGDKVFTEDPPLNTE